MSEYMFGVSYTKTTRKEAKRRDRICIDEGGYGLTEVNITEGETPGINNGRYQSWFSGPNRGMPFDDRLRPGHGSDRRGSRMNIVTGPYSAIVDGKPTGLAGCGRNDCTLPCLRKDARLDKRNRHGYRMLLDGRLEPVPQAECRTFIEAQ